MLAVQGRLLVVDDMANNRELLRRRFERLGYAIEEADGGRRALDLLAEGEFDLVLLDTAMPGMDGLSVLSEIRQTRSPAELPVVMVTAKATTEDVVTALELGANDYVTKPVNMAIAAARVSVQVSRKRAEDEARNARQALEDMVRQLRDGGGLCPNCRGPRAPTA